MIPLLLISKISVLCHIMVLKNIYLKVLCQLVFPLKESNAFLQQGHIKLIKSVSKDISIVTKTSLFQVNVVLLNFLFKESWKKKSCSHKKSFFSSCF